jgi:hypothetical protein
MISAFAEMPGLSSTLVVPSSVTSTSNFFTSCSPPHGLPEPAAIAAIFVTFPLSVRPAYVSMVTFATIQS